MAAVAMDAARPWRQSRFEFWVIHSYHEAMPPPIPVVLGAYNPEWPQMAAGYAERLQVLGPILVTHPSYRLNVCAGVGRQADH